MRCGIVAARWRRDSSGSQNMGDGRPRGRRSHRKEKTHVDRSIDVG
jgi:hypothetical protein